MGTIDLNQFTAFCAVAELGGFSAAATKLGLPKSSVSRAIGALEADLGVRLFHRTTRRVSLTTSGLALLAQVAPPLEALRRAAEEMPERDAAPSGLLRVTTLADLADDVVGEVAARLTAKHPKLSIELVLTERRVDLIAERIDVALRLTVHPFRDSSVVARRVGRVNMGLYAAPRYLKEHGTPRRPEQLSAHDWVTIGGSPFSQQMLLPRAHRSRTRALQRGARATLRRTRGRRNRNAAEPSR